MKTRLIVCALAGLFSTCSLGAATRPNIIYILADDLGWGDLSCYGQENFETPHLDRLVEEGVRFTAHYAGSTVCAPSRASLLTGRDQGHAYLRGNGKGEYSMPREELLPNITTALKGAGYRCAMIGKSSTACDTYNRFHPLDFGFDYHYGYLTHREAHRHYPQALWRNGEREYLVRNQHIIGREYAEDLFLEDALRWVEANRDKPFFLHLSMAVPHADLSAPEELVAPFRGQFEETPYPEGRHYYACEEPKATVAGMITGLDAHVGRLVSRIEELGLSEKTVIMFSSDNGPHAEGGHSFEALNSNGPWRGGKRDLYEGGIRVPLIVWGPGMVRSGVVTDHVSAFWDFMPTALDLAGIPWPEGQETEGISFAPLLRGEEQSEHDFLYWEFHEQGGKQAVRSGPWKAVRLDAQTDPDGVPELYNLKADPGETANLASARPEVLKRMIQLFDSRSSSWNPKWNYKN